MRARTVFVFALPLALGACATPHVFGPPPRMLPPLAIDTEASEVTSLIGDAAGHREKLAHFLEEFTRPDVPTDIRHPARFRAVVRGESHYGTLLMSIFYCGVYFGLATDCAYFDVDRAVDLEIEVDGSRFSGAGFSRRGASAWFNASGHYSLKEATEGAVRHGMGAGAYIAPAPSTLEGRP
jgi:hypothetical protein